MHMDFTLSDKQMHWRDRVVAFMAKHVYPAIPVHPANEPGTGKAAAVAGA
jgi:acyl-CoA dehydrogenase